MIDITRLEHALPHTGIELENLAYIKGFGTTYGMSLYPPTVGQAEPMLSITDTVQELLAWSGSDEAHARKEALIAQTEIPLHLPREQRPWCIGLSDEMLCVPASKVCEWIAARHPNCAGAAEFIRRCSDIVVDLPVFGLGEYGWQTRSLRELPNRTLSSGMCEFFCSLETTMILGFGNSSEAEGRALAAEWKRSLSSRTTDLVRQVGVELFHLADPDDELDDDLVHRFLALDYICHMAPGSNFVRYLLEISGARSVEELRQALLDPAAYSPDFRLSGFADYVDAIPWPRFEFGTAGARRIAVMPGGPDTLRQAEALVRTRIDGSLLFICDEGGELDTLISAASRSGASWEHCPIDNLIWENERRVLSDVAEIWAIRASSHHSNGEFSIVERRQLDLLAGALEMGIPAEWWDAGGWRTGSLDHYVRTIERRPPV